ncbi:unnamed protein product [Polarella glacialis]|uniref:RNA-dependent RNA polymerase n=1 Tax=Polarella glacialis TaxID=89957 RepID=A0A813HV22_POLGL|nr:unnamed protein product [Polarella glacialis]
MMGTPDGVDHRPVITWEKWPDRPFRSCISAVTEPQPLREVVVRLSEQNRLLRAVSVEVTFSNALLVHLPRSFERFGLLTIEGPIESVAVEGALRDGFDACGEPWHVFGCSGSMLKAERRRAYVMRGSPADLNLFCTSCFPGLGHKTLAKQVKYMGLLMSQCKVVFKLPPEVTIQACEDVERAGYCFTDGCDKISRNLALQLAKDLNLDSCPCIWQVRYCGHGHICKGILLVDQSLVGDKLVFRESMKKATIAGELESLADRLGIISWSRPHAMARLSNQALALLSSSVLEAVLESLHETHLSVVSRAAECPAAALVLLGQMRKLALWKKLKSACSAATPRAYQELLDLHADMLQGEGSKLQVHIPIADSRILYGACDPELGLKEGTCLVQVSLGTERVNVTGPVIVYRSPSYNPGDIRVLEAVDVPGCEVVDCILFSEEGLRPAADTMSGGDLDGDQFAVFWDHRLVRFSKEIGEAAPLDYQPPRSSSVTDSRDVIAYIAKSEQTLLGRIDCLFWRYAAAEGVASEACKELAEIFSRAVDKHPDDSVALYRLESGTMQARQRQTLWERLEQRQAVKLAFCDTQATEERWLRFQQSGCWERCPKMSSGSPWSELQGFVHEQAAAASRLLQTCSCLQPAEHHPDSQACNFECENGGCSLQHPALSQVAASWRARVQSTLCSDQVPAMQAYCSAERAVREVTDLLAGFRNAVADAEEAAAATAAGSAAADAAQLTLATALEVFQRAKSGQTWQELDEQVREGRFSLEQAEAELSKVTRQLHLLKRHAVHQFSDVAWSADATKTLRVFFQSWRTETTKQQQVALLSASHSKNKMQVDCLGQECRELEEKRAMHYSEEAMALAQRSLEEAKNSIQAVETALESLAAKVDRFFGGQGAVTQAGRAACNVQLRTALHREKRRLLNPLPVLAFRREILHALRAHGAVVVTAGTGSGKSTQVPAYLVDDLELAGPVVCTQPRRVAAKSLAERVAEEFGTDLGVLVGYHIGTRGGGVARQACEQTELLFVTDGLLLHNQRLRVGAMVVDEAHERGKDSDLILARWRKQRIDGGATAPLVVMSASIDAQRLAAYLSCPVVDVPGRLHEVQVIYNPTRAHGTVPGRPRVR